MTNLSRRDFLRLAGVGAASLTGDPDQQELVSKLSRLSNGGCEKLRPPARK